VMRYEEEEVGPLVCHLLAGTPTHTGTDGAYTQSNSGRKCEWGH
jgi:hypothetical protein